MADYVRATIYVSEHFKQFIPHFPKHMKAALHVALKHWHHQYLPLHFSRAAYYRYPGVYAARTRNYEKRKLRKFGHSDPLRWSDEMMNAALIGFTDKSTATSKQAKARASFRTPKVNLKTYRKDGMLSPVNKSEELKATNKPEMEYLLKLIIESLVDAQEEFNKVPRYRTIMRQVAA